MSYGPVRWTDSLVGQLVGERSRPDGERVEGRLLDRRTVPPPRHLQESKGRFTPEVLVHQSPTGKGYCLRGKPRHKSMEMSSRR